MAKVLATGLDGAGPFKGARAIAEEALRHTGGDPEAAIDRVVRVHLALVGVEGFVTGVPGGVAVLGAVPADLAAFYVLAGRMVGAVAHLRGYELKDDATRTVGFRLITKFGEKGVINLGKLVPLVGGPIGATTNVASLRTIAAFAKIALTPIPPAVGSTGSVPSTVPVP